MSRLDDIRARLEAATPGPWIDVGTFAEPGRRICVTCGNEGDA